MAQTFDAIISVVDEASKQILKIEADLRQMSAAGAAANEEMKLSGFDLAWHRVEEGAGVARERVAGLAEGFAGMGERLVEILPMFAAFGAAASGAGLVESIHSTAEMAEALEVAATKAGVTTQELQGLQFVAKQVGVPADTLTTSLGKLNRTIGEVAIGKNKTALAFLHSWNISLRDQRGRVRDAAQMLPQLEDAFARIKDPAEKALAAVSLFGRGGLDLLPILDLGSQKVSEIQGKFNEFGYTFSNKDKAALEDFNSSWKDLETSAGGFIDDVGSKLAPVLAPVAEGMAKWTAANRDWIATDIANEVVKFESGVQRIEGWLDKLSPPALTVWQDFQRGIGGVLNGVETAFQQASGVVSQSLTDVKQYMNYLGQPSSYATALAMLKKLESETEGLVSPSARQRNREMPSAGPVPHDSSIWKPWHDLIFGGPTFGTLPALHDDGSVDPRTGQPVSGDELALTPRNIYAPPPDDSLKAINDLSNAATALSRTEATAAQGSVIEVKVDFSNAPPGTSARTSTQGDTRIRAVTRLGYNGLISGHN